MSPCARFGMVLCCAVATTVASATERPISAAKLFLRRSPSGSEKLTFVSKDTAFLFPTLGGADDPSQPGSSGLVVELFTPSAPAGAALTAPGGSGLPGWAARASLPARLQFKNAGAPGSYSVLRSITLRQTKVLKINGKRTGLVLAAPVGSVGIRITPGSLVNCALFGAGTVQKDIPGTFVGRNALASALADCSDAALGAPTTTTSTTTSTTTTSTSVATTSTTSTTIPGVCGDGVVNQPSEVCDGATGACGGSGYPLMCGQAGTPSECQCCNAGGAVPDFPTHFLCCDPSADEVFFPSTSYCVNHDCSGPYQCVIGVCESGSCCTTLGDQCGLVGGGGSSAFVPCCGALQCRTSDATCCVADGGSCSGNTECCSANCDTGTCAP